MILFISPKYGNEPDAVRLIEAARKIQIKTSTLFNSWTSVKDQGICNGQQGTAAVYGEHAFCEFLAQEMNWNLFSNSLSWVSKIHSAFIKRGIRYMTMEELINNQSVNRNILGSRYLEPADDHCFEPGVYDNKFPRAAPDTKVLVQDNVSWQVKYRFLIVHGKVESFCCYKVAEVFNKPSIYQNKFVGRNIDPEQFVQSVLDNNNVAPACIMDVGFIANVGWAVCGTYPVWTSKLYGLDAEKFLAALFIACAPIQK